MVMIMMMSMMMVIIMIMINVMTTNPQVLNAIPFITEFTLACGNGEKPVLYADIEGELVPVVQSADGAKYQVQRNKRENLRND